MKNIKRQAKIFDLRRRTTIIAVRLGMKFQPKKGSSLYKRTPKNKVLPGQEEWKMPVGTLRFSNHWNYENQKWDMVYQTDESIPSEDYQWRLCVNTGKKPAWKVLMVVSGARAIREIDFQLIQKEIDRAISSFARHEGDSHRLDCPV